jgi:hypothetical protein
MGLSSARAGDEAAARLAASVASYALDIPVGEIIGDERGSLDIAFARQVARSIFAMSVLR